MKETESIEEHLKNPLNTHPCFDRWDVFLDDLVCKGEITKDEKYLSTAEFFPATGKMIVSVGNKKYNLQQVKGFFNRGGI